MAAAPYQNGSPETKTTTFLPLNLSSSFKPSLNGTGHSKTLLPDKPKRRRCLGGPIIISADSSRF